MANVFGRLKTTSLVTVDSYTVETSSITDLSYTAAELPQNQTRDITKIIKKKIPIVTGIEEHVFPFDSSLFNDPLLYVAETVLSPTIGTTLTKAIGVQWGFSKAKQIAEGCIFVLGDTQQLESEALLNPQKSTFTVNCIVPSATVAESTYSVTVYKYIPGYTAQRVFTWTSLDTPEAVCTKWKAVMEPYVTFGGTSSSFGHAVLSYDRGTGKYIGSFDPDTAWGGSLFTLYYEIYRYTGSDDASKGLNRRPIKFDITRFHDEFNSNLSFFNPAIAYTMIFSNSDIVYDILFFAEKRLPTSIGHNSFFSGDVIARSSNGESYNIVDNLVLLNSELLTTEAVTILSCIAAEDSWIVISTPAYNPTVVNALNKVSPAFTNQTAIATDPNWPITTGWRASQSSIYQNYSAFIGWKSVDRIDNTYWASAETSYSASGVGNQWVHMEFPSAVKMVSHTMNPVNTLNTGVPLQWTLSGSNNNSTFRGRQFTLYFMS
ncbi:hypothetical protein T492DRAFT_840699 [Pavlovales sp. CCMP2436]|nr:hypothetical protein T492DRAFT_840699 [Pavlovales sp. CCMP2436]